MKNIYISLKVTYVNIYKKRLENFKGASRRKFKD